MRLCNLIRVPLLTNIKFEVDEDSVCQGPGEHVRLCNLIRVPLLTNIKFEVDEDSACSDQIKL